MIVHTDITNEDVQEALDIGFYVDNLLNACDDEQFVIRMYEQARAAFGRRGFNLRQWVSTSQLLNNRAKQDGVYDDSNPVTVLGHWWYRDKDVMSFKAMKPWDGRYTKKSALSFINGFFDPLNRMCPVAIQGRVCLQKLWAGK